MLLPSFNRRRFLGQALESVRRQTFTSWRLLVYDDGSTDGSAELAAELAQSDARIEVQSGLHRGLLGNWQAGFSAATGVYFAVIHDDDEWESEFLDECVTRLERHPEAAWISTDHSFIDAQGRDLPAEADEATQIFGRDRLVEGVINDVRAQVMQRQPFHIGASVFRAATLRRVGFIRPEAGYVFDFDLFLRLADAGYSAYFLPRRLMRYRVHGQQVTAQNVLEKALGLIPLMESRRFTEPDLETARTRRLDAAVYAAGIAYLRRSQPVSARRYLRRAIKSRRHAPRASVALVLSFLPAQAAQAILRVARRRE